VLRQKVSKLTFPNVYYVELSLKRINVSFPPRVKWTEICELVLVKGILGSILSTNALATCPAPTLWSGFSLPVPREKRDPWNEVGQRSSCHFQYIYLCLNVLKKRTFFILFERAFKMKIDVYFIVIALLGAELFKTKVYANWVTCDVTK